MKKIALVLAALVLVGCGEKTIEGTFVNEITGWTYTFSKDGTFIQENIRDATPIKYTVDGENILVQGTNAGQMQLMPNGDISSAMGKMVRKK